MRAVDHDAEHTAAAEWGPGPGSRSGDFVIACSGFFPNNPSPYFNDVARVDAAGTATILATPPVGGWGSMADIAVNNAMDSHGAPSDGLNHYWFENLAFAASRGLELTIQ